MKIVGIIIGSTAALAVVLAAVVVVQKFPEHSATVTNGLGQPVRVSLCGFGVDAVDLDRGSQVKLDLLPWESSCAVYVGDDAQHYAGCLRIGDKGAVVISEASLQRTASLNHC
jgi:hypothetical protein